MKTNIVHTLFSVQKYGQMTLDQFTDILSPADLEKCKKSRSKTWYSLSLNVFTNFTFQVIYYFELQPRDFRMLNSCIMSISIAFSK